MPSRVTKKKVFRTRPMQNYVSSSRKGTCSPKPWPGECGLANEKAFGRQKKEGKKAAAHSTFLFLYIAPIVLRNIATARSAMLSTNEPACLDHLWRHL